MRTHMQVADPQEKYERAAVVSPVVSFPEANQPCPVCGAPLRGRQRNACSDKSRAARSRRERAEEQTEWNQRVRELLEAAVRVLGGRKRMTSVDTRRARR